MGANEPKNEAVTQARNALDKYDRNSITQLSLAKYPPWNMIANQMSLPNEPNVQQQISN